MGVKEDLQAEVRGIFTSLWTQREGRVVPQPSDLKLSNDRVELKATVLYADLARSTYLVDSQLAEFAIEIYKAFLRCCARIINMNDGVITAYDGDRIMAVYLGDYKNTNAAKTALHINYAMNNIIRPSLKDVYPSNTFVPSHGVGIDTSVINVARIGVRNNNDLAWIGRAGNHAAKLSDLREGDYTAFISSDVHYMAADEAKISSDGRSMWEQTTWNTMGNRVIYRSKWSWEF